MCGIGARTSFGGVEGLDFVDIEFVSKTDVEDTRHDGKAISVARCTEATYAEYRRQKARVSGRRGFRLTSLVTARSALSLGFVGNPALSNKRLKCKARTLRLQKIR